MLYLILLIVVLLLFAVMMYFEEKRIQNLKSQLKTLKEEKQNQSHAILECGESKQQIWDAMNTIHLYATLSEEEAKTDSLKEKQVEIQKIAEEWLGDSRIRNQ